MKKLTYTETISAPVSTVWSTMLDEGTYREWTSEFGDSRYTGSWELGSQIRFIGEDDEGNTGGMFGYITANRPHEYVEVEYLGQVSEGVDDTESEYAKSIAGTHESYSFTEDNGVTTVVVELETTDELAGMFDEMWPAALVKLKKIAELV